MPSKTTLYPLTFQPIFKERVWGGRNLERLYGKELPANVPVGESWEITDRPEGVSVIVNGPLAGKDLRWLMENHGEELLGPARTANGRFPLLVKLLDAQEKLSLQVHPPQQKAAALGGEPKTEMWYVADATPEAEIFVGLKRGATREEFERRIRDGTVAQCFHRHHIKRGDAMFLPSGRVHALGAGCVIFEIQQNSDTTYRVFDWNRVGLDGKPRELHVEQALASIDFNDFEPPLLQSGVSASTDTGILKLVESPLFSVYVERGRSHTGAETGQLGLHLVGVIEGEMQISAGGREVRLKAGQFCLLPAAVGRVDLWWDAAITYLVARPR